MTRPAKMYHSVCLTVLLSHLMFDNIAAQSLCSPIDFASTDDFPECTFGCFCFGGVVRLPGYFSSDESSDTVCHYPVCGGFVECANPTISCGCPTCDGRQDCVAVDEYGKEVIINAGQAEVVGCAICQCNSVEQAVPSAGYPSGRIPIEQRRNATCDYSQCACYGHDVSIVFDNISDIPSCTFGCFCIRSLNQVLCANPRACEVSNRCQNPLDSCGCPICTDQVGDCFAKSFDDEEVLISGDGPQDVGCAVCTCDAPMQPIIIPFTLQTPIPLLPKRTATCDYSQCACHGHDDSEVFDNTNDIPECTFGCFCIRYENVVLCKDPGACEVSNRCQQPRDVCGCPVCEDTVGDCLAKSFDDQEVLISADGPQEVGCAVCTCDAPVEPITIPVITPETPIPSIQKRIATCDYSQCVCYEFDESQVFDNATDIPECTFGCFCIRSVNQVLCVDPAPLCVVSNRCQHPGDVCGCPTCADTVGDCFAKSFDNEEVLISGDGPQDVGCAVCTCDAPIQPIIIPFFTLETPIPIIPARTATCDYSKCACHGFDESEVFDNISDILECTFGCFCIRSENAVLCVDPGPCEVSNRCQNPVDVCGCPTCTDTVGDCFAKSSDNKEVLISGGGPQVVGCAVCTCDLPIEPIVIPFFTSSTPIPIVPLRTSTCDYTQCACQGLDESEVFDNISDIPECTFSCFCIRSENAVLCVDPGPCEVSNRCQNPVDVCGCPTCTDTVGDCFAKSSDNKEVLISGGGPQVVGCAVCTCDLPIEPIIIPFFTSSTPIPIVPLRTSTCDYTQCACQGRDESEVFDTIADIPDCSFGCFCIRADNQDLCIDSVCLLSNKCQNPNYICGCPVCENAADDCLAKSFGNEDVLISGDGPQNIGCAVCTCDAPSDPIPFFIPGIQIPVLPNRGHACDYSACYGTFCGDYNSTNIFDTEADIPECAVGCFCLRSSGQEICRPQRSCEISNRCLFPSYDCGCQVCPTVEGDCVAEAGGIIEIIPGGVSKIVGTCYRCVCLPFIILTEDEVNSNHLLQIEILRRLARCEWDSSLCPDNV
ncbi:uncharacterized protein LOC117105439 [Anneissia japonica]|uniref:uncharacterized protein LOC117105439 n=1 Tax=Anneissia japonica TaxID=1529436 RepID=UPI0014256E1F|nr:uncharacterized protein LOC117105439 [Anneissia japonica]XP_033102462.1 uncharacterized protein LOC117105439 [Anneissia japonica]